MKVKLSTAVTMKLDYGGKLMINLKRTTESKYLGCDFNLMFFVTNCEDS